MQSPPFRSLLLALALALLASAALGLTQIGGGTIPLRSSDPGPVSLLPRFQVLADYPQAETTGFPHYFNKRTNVVYVEFLEHGAVRLSTQDLDASMRAP